MAMNSTVQEQLEKRMRLKLTSAGSRGSTWVLLMPTSVVLKLSETAVKRLNSFLETGPNLSSSTADVVQLVSANYSAKVMTIHFEPFLLVLLMTYIVYEHKAETLLFCWLWKSVVKQLQHFVINIKTDSSHTDVNNFLNYQSSQNVIKPEWTNTWKPRMFWTVSTLRLLSMET